MPETLCNRMKGGLKQMSRQMSGYLTTGLQSRVRPMMKPIRWSIYYTEWRENTSLYELAQNDKQYLFHIPNGVMSDRAIDRIHKREKQVSQSPACFQMMTASIVIFSPCFHSCDLCEYRDIAQLSADQTDCVDRSNLLLRPCRHCLHLL